MKTPSFVLSLLMIALPAGPALAEKGGKGPSDSAYEHASDKASFKRADGKGGKDMEKDRSRETRDRERSEQDDHDRERSEQRHTERERLEEHEQERERERENGEELEQLTDKARTREREKSSGQRRERTATGEN